MPTLYELRKKKPFWLVSEGRRYQPRAFTEKELLVILFWGAVAAVGCFLFVGLWFRIPAWVWTR